MSIGIYKIENILNGKIYIGQSKHIETRWSEHCRESNQEKSLISKAIAKYGKENFIF
jgi:group I intron endonuclease